jgi:hypothetical protein
MMNRAHGRLNLREKLLTRWRRGDAARASVEQSDTKPGLEPRDCLTQSRRGNTDIGGRGAEVSSPGNSDHRVEFSDAHLPHYS